MDMLPPTNTLRTAAPAAMAAPASAPTPAEKMALEFDRMLLRNVVETMLPKDGVAFGGGIGADLWRSQLADAVAGQLALSGALSFADMAGLKEGGEG